MMSRVTHFAQALGAAAALVLAGQLGSAGKRGPNTRVAGRQFDRRVRGDAQPQH